MAEVKQQNEDDISDDEVWNKDIFVNKGLVNAFACLTCKQIPKNPYIADDNIYCQTHKLNNSNESSFVKKQIKGQEIYCPYEINSKTCLQKEGNLGCKWKGKLTELNIHLKKCEYNKTINVKFYKINQKFKSKIKILNNENKLMKDEIDSLKAEIVTLKNDDIYSKNIINNLKAQLIAIKNDIKTVKGNINFNESWCNYGGQYATAKWKKIGNIVQLEGLVKSNNFNGKTTICTLPNNISPKQRLIFTLNQNETQFRVDVLPNGTVVYCAGINKHSWISLNGINYILD